MKTIGEIFLVLFFTSLATGRKGFGPTEQEWGYVTVREKAHMFWWLHQTSAAVDNYFERPLVIWLQGGPGASSTGYGNFAEIGPLDIDLNPRNTTWLNNVNLLFVDNPVGTGFSYVDELSALTTSNRQIAEDFIVFLKEFYKTAPELKNTTLYIFSESYGGKMAVEIALLINEAIRGGDLEVNVAGIGLGDSWISPVDSVLTWAPYLLNLGIIDQIGYNKIQEKAEAVQTALDNEQYREATNYFRMAEFAVLLATENVNLYNVLTKIALPESLSTDEDEKIKQIMNDQVKTALGLENEWGVQSRAVFTYLYEDFMKPATHIVELLLNTSDTKIVVYNGQLDLIVDVLGTVKWVDHLKFNGSVNWREAPRNPLVVNNIVEGYYKTSGSLTMYWIDRAGHMVATDNPCAMNYILYNITTGFIN